MTDVYQYLSTFIGPYRPFKTEKNDIQYVNIKIFTIGNHEVHPHRVDTQKPTMRHYDH